MSLILGPGIIGNPGGARSFGGSDFITIGASGGAQWLNPASLTISLWFNRVSSTNGWWVTRDDNVLGRAFSFGLNGGSGLLELQPNGVNLFSRTAPSAGVWHHHAVAGPGSGWNYFEDGAKFASGSTTAMGTATGPAILGKRSYSGFNEPCSGKMAHVGLWNVVLSDAEMQSLYAGTTPDLIRPGSLIGYWPLDGIGAPALDRSGHRSNGVLSGSSLVSGPPRIARNIGPQIFGTATGGFFSRYYYDMTRAA